MLILTNKQIEVFKDEAIKKFQAEMFQHVKTFFRDHFIISQENGIRETINCGYLKATKHGFTTERNICLYINMMMMLGSNFDLDPQYPWAQLLLAEEKQKNQTYRIDILSDKALETINQFAGREGIYMRRALLHIGQNAKTIFKELMDYRHKQPLQYLNNLFPQKYEVIGQPNLKQMCTLGANSARKYGLTQEPNQLVFYACMFIMGSGFDKDPQFAAAKQILNNSGFSDQRRKTEALYEHLIKNLQLILPPI